MDISRQIEAVYQRALLLRQYAVESPVPQDLLEKSLQELYFVLEELQTAQEELYQQNQVLSATRQSVELERQRYQTLFELAPSGYLITDLYGNILQANYTAAQLFSIPQDFLINKPLLVFVHQPDRPQFQAHLAHLTPGHTWEITLNPRDGTLISVAIAITRIKDARQQKDMLLWSLHDITHRKQMEHQLQVVRDQLETRVAERTAELSQANARLQQEIHDHQQAEQKIRDQAALIDIASDAIFVLDLEQQIIFWSKGAERLYGWTATEILEISAAVLFSPEDTAQLTQGVNRTVEQGSWQAELEQVTHIGNPINVESRWNLVLDATGQSRSILVVNTDITGKKQLEAQFYRAQRIESLGTLASGIAHDLNNVLTPIVCLSQMQLLQGEKLGKRTHETWQVVKDSAQRGVNLVEQIKLFARGTSGKRTPLQVGDLLLEIAQVIQQTFPKSITLCTDIPTHPLRWVVADQTQLYQVVMNLCVNARDAMPNGGTLTLAIDQCEVDIIKAQQYLEVHPGHYITQ